MAHRLFLYHCRRLQQDPPGDIRVVCGVAMKVVWKSRTCALSIAGLAVRSSQVTRAMALEKDTGVLYREETVAWLHRHLRLHFSRLSPHPPPICCRRRWPGQGNLQCWPEAPSSSFRKIAPLVVSGIARDITRRTQAKVTRSFSCNKIDARCNLRVRIRWCGAILFPQAGVD